MVAVSLVLSAGSAVAQTSTRRFALFVGNNEGGEGTQALQYATDDARRMHEVFIRLGGVDPADAMVLLDEKEPDVSTALDELERRSKDARARGAKTSGRTRTGLGATLCCEGDVGHGRGPCGSGCCGPVKRRCDVQT